jgi:hypothetical protein
MNHWILCQDDEQQVHVILFKAGEKDALKGSYWEL